MNKKIDIYLKKWLKRFSFVDGLEFSYGACNYGESWKVIKFGGKPLEKIEIYSDYDCTGKTFCKYVDSYLGGFITVGHYGIDC